MSDSLTDLTQALRTFSEVRDWRQFHSPKNLASALVVEAGELLEHFQWLTDEQSRSLPDENRKAAAAEAADVLLYLIQFCDSLGIDLIAAAENKLQVNAEKYPVDLSKGSSKKYNRL